MTDSRRSFTPGLIFILFILFFGVPIFAQNESTTVSGQLIAADTNEEVMFANVLLYDSEGVEFLKGTVTDQQGQFNFGGLVRGNYVLKVSYIGYKNYDQRFYVGRLSEYLDLGIILLEAVAYEINELEISARRDEIGRNLDRRVYNMDDQISQQGGSVLNAMQNLPGVTINRDGEVEIRGSNRVAVLIDGQQTAITGMGAQSGLDNIPVSSIERIEIINNPSSRYDANAMAGIINIVYKKGIEKGWNGNFNFSAGVGSLSKKRENIANIRDQYRFTPKLNPGFSVNYRQNNLNFFGQGDVLWHKLITRNEFIVREYSGDQAAIRQQFLENRTQPIYNIKIGLDWMPNAQNSLTFFTLYNQRDYTDLGDLPYLNNETEELIRLWQYYEYESNKTFMASVAHQFSFPQSGRRLESSFNYSFRRKDELFHFTNWELGVTGTDTTDLTADENIFDLEIDYFQPLRSGRFETGVKGRARIFPNEITFTPGINSILDLDLQGTAEYREWLYASYGNYIYENPEFEIEAGLRIEYAEVDYLVDPNHSTYESDGYDYFGVFPSLRAAYLFNDANNISFFYNRRVDRPAESQLRAFPHYSDPEILNLGNPGLQPQFTNSLELAYKRTYQEGYLYLAAYTRNSKQLITTIITKVGDEEDRLVRIDQNADKGSNRGVELAWSHSWSSNFRMNINSNFYENTIGAFSLSNAYPKITEFSQERQRSWTGNVKAGTTISLLANIQLQLSFIYFAPDIIPQGEIFERYGMDFGLRMPIQEERGEIFLNGSDVFNTMRVKTSIEGSDFLLQSSDYYETQVFRAGYQYRF